MSRRKPTPADVPRHVTAAREHDGDRSVDELVADPAVARALHALGRKLPDDPCPRCMEAPIAANSRHGFCQPCSTAQDERIKASRRRSYHRRRPIPAGVPTARETSRDATGRDDEGIDVVASDGSPFLRIAEAAELLRIGRATLYRWIGQGIIASIKLGGVRYVTSDEIVRVLEQAERQEQPDG